MSEHHKLRAAQARAVMPLIGGLLDAWDSLPNDLRSDIAEAGLLAGYLNKINDAMEGAGAGWTDHLPLSPDTISKIAKG